MLLPKTTLLGLFSCLIRTMCERSTQAFNSINIFLLPSDCRVGTNDLCEWFISASDVQLARPFSRCPRREEIIIFHKFFSTACRSPFAIRDTICCRTQGADHCATMSLFLLLEALMTWDTLWTLRYIRLSWKTMLGVGKEQY